MKFGCVGLQGVDYVVLIFLGCYVEYYDGSQQDDCCIVWNGDFCEYVEYVVMMNGMLFCIFCVIVVDFE